MSTFVSDRYASLGNDTLRRYGIITNPYEMQDQTAYPRITPTWIFPSNYHNFKNAKSGQYNRRTCDKCANFVGFPQSPGIYPITTGPPFATNEIPINYQKMVNAQYKNYQQARMCNNPGYPSILGEGKSGTMPTFKPGTCGSYRIPGYSNYHDKTQVNLYPKRYVKGWWPDEQQDVTNIPRPEYPYGYNSPVNNC